MDLILSNRTDALDAGVNEGKNEPDDLNLPDIQSIFHGWIPICILKDNLVLMLLLCNQIIYNSFGKDNPLFLQ